MQVSLNNLAPPGPGGGLGSVPEAKTKSGGSSDFKALMKKEPKDSGGKSSEVLQSDEPIRRVGSPKVSSKVSQSKGSDQVTDSLEGEEVSTAGKTPKSREVKNKAIQKFMDSLEGELGISAERFSAVLSQLPAEVKALPVEQSAPEVIEQLGVATEQRDQALATYVGLLHEAGIGRQSSLATPVSVVSTDQFLMKPSVASPSLPNAESVAPKEILTNLESMTPRQKLNASIDDLNRRFFDIKAPSAKDGGIPLETLEGLEPVAPEEETNLRFNSLPTESPKVTIGSRFQNLEPVLPQESGQQRWEQVLVQDQAVDPRQQRPEFVSLHDLEGLQVSPMEIEMMGSEAMPSELVDTKVKMPNAPKAWTVEELPYLVKNQSLSQDAVKGFESFSQADKFTSGERLLQNDKDRELMGYESSEEELSNNFFIAPEEDKQSRTMTQQQPVSKTSFSMEAMVSPRDRIENLQRLSMATESLAAKGGGEVKVLLNPEGLGSVQLKVRMLEGKLHVEMKAENRASQQLIENNLQELKQNLSAHQLSLDSVKVDVGGDYTRQESSQTFQPPPQFDMNREQARQFMNQFRDSNLFQRQAFFEAPGLKTYRSHKDETVNPISQEIRPRSSLSANKGRELNLVA